MYGCILSLSCLFTQAAEIRVLQPAATLGEVAVFGGVWGKKEALFQYHTEAAAAPICSGVLKILSIPENALHPGSPRTRSNQIFRTHVLRGKKKVAEIRRLMRCRPCRKKNLPI